MSDRKIIIDDSRDYFIKVGLQMKEFPSKYSLIRYSALSVVQSLSSQLQSCALFEQQLSELIANAVIHGNKCDENKTVRVWYGITGNICRCIIEDEGMRFKEIERWNEWYKRRNMCISSGDTQDLSQYLIYQPSGRFDEDSSGGNALCAAVEYWNAGIVYSSRGNSVAVCRYIDTELVYD